MNCKHNVHEHRNNMFLRICHETLEVLWLAIDNRVVLSYAWFGVEMHHQHLFKHCKHLNLFYLKSFVCTDRASFVSLFLLNPGSKNFTFRNPIGLNFEFHFFIILYKLVSSW